MNDLPAEDDLSQQQLRRVIQLIKENPEIASRFALPEQIELNRWVIVYDKQLKMTVQLILLEDDDDDGDDQEETLQIATLMRVAEQQPSYFAKIYEVIRIVKDQRYKIIVSEPLQSVFLFSCAPNVAATTASTRAFAHHIVQGLKLLEANGISVKQMSLQALKEKQVDQLDLGSSHAPSSYFLPKIDLIDVLVDSKRNNAGNCHFIDRPMQVLRTTAVALILLDNIIFQKNINDIQELLSTLSSSHCLAIAEQLTTGNSIPSSMEVQNSEIAHVYSIMLSEKHQKMSLKVLLDMLIEGTEEEEEDEEPFSETISPQNLQQIGGGAATNFVQPIQIQPQRIEVSLPDQTTMVSRYMDQVSRCTSKKHVFNHRMSPSRGTASTFYRPENARQDCIDDDFLGDYGGNSAQQERVKKVFVEDKKNVIFSKKQASFTEITAGQISVNRLTAAAAAAEESSPNNLSFKEEIEVRVEGNCAETEQLHEEKNQKQNDEESKGLSAAVVVSAQEYPNPPAKNVNVQQIILDEYRYCLSNLGVSTERFENMSLRVEYVKEDSACSCCIQLSSSLPQQASTDHRRRVIELNLRSQVNPLIGKNLLRLLLGPFVKIFNKPFEEPAWREQFFAVRISQIIWRFLGKFLNVVVMICLAIMYFAMLSIYLMIVMLFACLMQAAVLLCLLPCGYTGVSQRLSSRISDETSRLVRHKQQTFHWFKGIDEGFELAKHLVAFHVCKPPIIQSKLAIIQQRKSINSNNRQVDDHNYNL